MKKRGELTASEAQYLREHVYYRLFVEGDGVDSTAAQREAEWIHDMEKNDNTLRVIISKLSHMMFDGRA